MHGIVERVHDHRVVGLEDQQLPSRRDRAVDPDVVEVEACGRFAQRLGEIAGEDAAEGAKNACSSSRIHWCSVIGAS